MNDLGLEARAVAMHVEIQDRIAEAMVALGRMPDKERRFLSAGERCSMPAVVLGYWEAFAVGIERTARARPSPPSSRVIDRMHETLDWLTWLGKQSPREMKAVVLCFGLGRRTGEAARVMDVTRRTIERLRKAGVHRLAMHLVMAHKKAA